MKKELLYIHGLGSSQNSRKYKLIESQFQNNYNCYCAAWDNDTNIQQFIRDLYDRYHTISELVLIGDSTGGNYASQLRDQLTAEGVKVKLILLNPLLNIAHRIATFTFPDSLLSSLLPYEEVSDCFLLQSHSDEVIDQSQIRIGVHVDQVRVHDSHRLLKFAEHIPYIKAYVNKGR